MKQLLGTLAAIAIALPLFAQTSNPYSTESAMGSGSTATKSSDMKKQQEEMTEKSKAELEKLKAEEAQKMEEAKESVPAVEPENVEDNNTTEEMDQ